MLIKYFILFCSIALTPSMLFGQDQMIVNTPGEGWTYYDDHSKEISSLKKVPRYINAVVDSVLSIRLGEFKNSVTFSHGQVVNVRKVLSEDGPSEYEWVIPKYDLCFNLRDTLFGIKNYALNIRLDQYGQLLYINWPLGGHRSKTAFTDRQIIMVRALQKAKDLKFKENYKVYFLYDERSEAFYWRFLFPQVPELPQYDWYNAIDINWCDINDIKFSSMGP